MGLVVTLAFFGSVELALRAVYGTPENTRFLRPHWLAEGSFFKVEGEKVRTTYQGIDRIDPFPVAPTAGTLRMMGFGESSMRGGSGLPPSREFMGLIAQNLDKEGIPVESLNLGRSGMDTNTLPRLVYEAMAYKPDLAVFYFGHNDIANSTLEKRYGDVSGAIEARLTVLMERTQLFTQLQRRVAQRDFSRPHGPAESLAMSPEQTLMAVANYARNLRRAVQICQDAGADVVLITPGSPIDKWFGSAPICPDALPATAWAAWRSGQQLQLSQINPSDVVKAHEIAPDCPEVEYLWGLLLLQQGKRAEGWAQLAEARDDDPAPMRATSGVVQSVRDIASSMDAGLVDFEGSLRERDTLSGLFTDNVHLNVETHILLAKLATPIIQQRIQQRRAQAR